MEAIVLAGGLGTRLQDIVKDVPKPMADIGGRPFLSYVLDLLSFNGVRRILLSVGYKREMIERFFGNRYGGMEIVYIAEGEPLGTGGAVREALRSAGDADIIVVNGDTYFAVDLRKMLAFHRRKKADITIAVKAVDAADRYGTVIVGRDERITAFGEKTGGSPGYINGGVYAVSRNIAGRLAGLGGNFSLERDFLEKSADTLAVHAFVSSAFFIDIGTPGDYEKAAKAMPIMAAERTT